jgi:hypothetical protein
MSGRIVFGVVTLVLVSVATACKGGGLITPTGASQPGEAFEVTGVVTDDHAVPVAGAYVTMARLEARPSVVTDASGAYKIDFKAMPRVNPLTGGSFLARAEILADGYDEYWRNVEASSHLIENFRLHRITQVTAGDSIFLSVTPDNGDCHADLYGPCGRLRVSVPANGKLRLDAVPTRQGGAPPQLDVCCAAGNERYGNPITIPVTAGMELRVEVGHAWPGVATSESIIVNTSPEAF